MPRSLKRRCFALLTASGLLAVLAGGLVPLVDAAPSTAPSAQRGGRQSPCDCAITRTVAPDVLRRCETSTVTVTMQPHCPGQRIHIVYIVDEVYKPNFSEPQDRFRALRQSVQRLELRDNPHIEVGVVWTQRGTAVRRLELTNDEQRVITFLDPPEVSRFDARPQCFDCGFREAIRILNEGETLHPDVEIDEIVVLAPLGVYTPGAAPGVLKGAQQAKARDATVISTCFAWTHCDAVLRRAASQPRLYLGYRESNRLAAIVDDVVKSSVSTFLRDAALVESLPEGLSLVPDSFNLEPESVDVAAGTVRWELEDPIERPVTVTYRVQPNALGVFTVGLSSMVSMRDSVYRQIEVRPATARITVTEPCEQPSPTPLPTATPTRTPVPPTATELPSATPLPSATATPGPIYLPLTLRERCRPDKERADVVVVLDASTSMAEPTRSGRAKIEAAAEAARRFVAALDFDPNAEGKADQAALVAFNAQATVLVPLGRDRAALHGALRELPLAMTTRLDLGIAAASEALDAPSRDVRNTPVIVLLTDGRANPVPVSVAVERAEEAKARGILLYTIALGDEVDEAALQRMASDPAAFRRAADGEDLLAIYQEVTADIPCRREPFWPATP